MHLALDDTGSGHGNTLAVRGSSWPGPLALLLVIAAALGCAGSELNLGETEDPGEGENIGFVQTDATTMGNDGGPQTDATAPLSDTTAPLPDATAPQQDTTAPLPDAKSPLPDTTTPLPDATAPQQDTTAPQQDTTAPQQDTTAPAPDAFVPNLGGPGDPCPCGGGTLCFDGVCRPLCTEPTDPCKAVSSCPNDHACVGMINNTASVCLPAVAPGQACGPDDFCPVGHVCGSVNTSPYICLPTCTGAGSACGSGGICLQTQSGCAFCSVP